MLYTRFVWKEIPLEASCSCTRSFSQHFRDIWKRKLPKLVKKSVDKHSVDYKSCLTEAIFQVKIIEEVQESDKTTEEINQMIKNLISIYFYFSFCTIKWNKLKKKLAFIIARWVVERNKGNRRQNQRTNAEQIPSNSFSSTQPSSCCSKTSRSTQEIMKFSVKPSASRTGQIATEMLQNLRKKNEDIKMKLEKKLQDISFLKQLLMSRTALNLSLNVFLSIDRCAGRKRKLQFSLWIIFPSIDRCAGWKVQFSILICWGWGADDLENSIFHWK